MAVEPFSFEKKDFVITTEKDNAKARGRQMKKLQEALVYRLSDNFQDFIPYTSNYWKQATKKGDPNGVYRDHTWIGFFEQGIYQWQTKEKRDVPQFQVSLNDNGLHILVDIDHSSRRAREAVCEVVKKHKGECFDILKKLGNDWSVRVKSNNKTKKFKAIPLPDHKKIEWSISQLKLEDMDVIINYLTFPSGELDVERNFTESEALNMKTSIVDELSNGFEKLYPLYTFLTEQNSPKSESCDYWLFKAGTKVTAEWDEMLDANKIKYEELEIDLSKFFDENGKSKYEIPLKWKKKFSDELKDEIDKKLSIKDFPKGSQSRGTKISWVGITARNFAEIKKNDIVVVWSGHKIHGHGKVVGGYDADYSKEVEWDKTFVEIELPKATPENKLELRWKAGEIQPLPDEWKNWLFGKKQQNYFIITQNPDSGYDDVEGVHYQYDNHKQNFRSFVEGSNFIVQSKINGVNHFVGYGKVGTIETSEGTTEKGGSITKFTAKYSDYTPLEEPKIRTDEIHQKMKEQKSYGGRAPSILPIDQSLYAEIIGEDLIDDDQLSDTLDLDKFVKALDWKPNLILYGPPGTGKTYHATEIAKLITRDQHTAGTNITLKPQTWLAVATKVLLENNGTVTNYQDITKLAATFYPNDTVGRTPHETIAKDIRNDIDNNGDDSFFVHPSDGMYGLKTPTSFVKAAEIILLAEHKPLHTDKITEIATSKSMIRQNEQPGITPTRSMNQVITQDIARNGDNSTFVKISPATYILRKQIRKESTTQNKNQYYKTVTFHQTFSYEEFMEGIKAKPTEDGTGVVYAEEDGIFKKFCETAADDDKTKYIMIIDEINRGNIAKIFGELITIIEKDKRESKKITLAYSKKEFSVPKNVLIIGTMNTADQSLTHLDAALKRRFTMMEIYPDPSVLRNHKVEGKINLTELLVAINRKLIDNKFRDGQIGHAYFMSGKDPLSKISELQMVFAYDIIPLLREYFYDDESKMKGIFGEGNWQSWFDEKSGDINKMWQGSDGEENFVDNIKKSFGV